MIKKIKSYIKSKTQKLRFSLSAHNNPLFLGYYTYFYKPKPGSLNEFLDVYSRSKKGDFYVIQIGANDGITHDPIHKFIKRDGWKGVLLEPQAYVFNHFLKKIYAKNAGITPLCAAIGPEDGSMPLYKIGFSNMRWATGLASFQKENVEKAFSSGLVQAQCLKYQIQIPEASRRIIAEDVSVVSPETLLNRYGINAIDLLQIDAEGFDYEVIKIFKIGQIKPKAIIFEHTHLSKHDSASCLGHLEENGYKVAHFGPNTLAMLPPITGFEKFF